MGDDEAAPEPSQFVLPDQSVLELLVQHSPLAVPIECECGFRGDAQAYAVHLAATVFGHLLRRHNP